MVSLLTTRRDNRLPPVTKNGRLLCPVQHPNGLKELLAGTYHEIYFWQTSKILTSNSRGLASTNLSYRPSAKLR